MIRALLVFAIIGFMGYYGRLYTPTYTEEKEFKEEEEDLV